MNKRSNRAVQRARLTRAGRIFGVVAILCLLTSLIAGPLISLIAFAIALALGLALLGWAWSRRSDQAGAHNLMVGMAASNCLV